MERAESESDVTTFSFQNNHDEPKDVHSHKLHESKHVSSHQTIHPINLQALFETKSTGQWRFTHFNEKNGQIKGVGWLLDNTQLYNFNIYQVKTCITVELISRRKVKFFCHQDRVTDLLNKIFYKKTKST